jgi:hypothetical protein
MPPHDAVKALSWQSAELVQPPQLPLIHKSGEQSESLVHALVQAPWLEPTHVCEPPQSSPVAHAQVPLTQLPLAQSELATQTFGEQEPPHVLPVLQSLSALQAF